uniref:Uncharacterized protein n=1 Tax=Picea sitchensis TaxID=3332 RepID=A9NWG0_PICSI|nr:unknown [Picea sitchensis]
MIILVPEARSLTGFVGLIASLVFLDQSTRSALPAWAGCREKTRKAMFFF